MGRIHREQAALLQLSDGPLARFELARRVVNAGAYGRKLKIKRVYSHIKDVVKGMESRMIVEPSGQVPTKKSGSQETWGLTAYGRLIASTVFFNDKDVLALSPAKLRADILAFIEEYGNGDNLFVRFDFEVMKSMLEDGDLEILAKFFWIGVQFFSVDDLRRPTPGWIRYLGEMWTAYLNFPADTG